MVQTSCWPNDKRSSKTAAAAARLGSASLRICDPRGSRVKHVREFDSDHSPTLTPGKVCTWFLDLQNAEHASLLCSFVREQVKGGVFGRIALLTSPPCTPWSPWGRVNKAKRRAMSRRNRVAALTRWKATYNAGISNIRLARRLQSLGMDYLSQKTSLVRIHEQPAQASMPIDSLADSRLAGNSWPWALSSSPTKSIVSGCEVGLKSASGSLMSKKWAFEVHGSQPLVDALAKLVCTHNVRHAQAAGADTQRSGFYSLKLGTILARGALL